MSKSFADLMKQRKAQKAALEEKINSDNRTIEQDERFWSHKHLINEKTKKGYAKIRFLPAADGEVDSYVQVLGYFQKSKKNNFYYVHNSHHSFDKKAEDPAYEYNGKMFNKYGSEQAKKYTIRRMKKYFSNILVIEDPIEPENEGKVFLFEYGPQIFEKIQQAFNVDEEAGETEDDSIDVFDPIEGATFHLKITPKKIGADLAHTYETSTFLDVGPITNKDGEELSEEEIAAVWEKCLPLAEFIDPENEDMYKSIDQQKKDFSKWLGEETDEQSEDESSPEEDDEELDAASAEEDDDTVDDDELPWDADDADEEDIDDFFKNLQN